MARGKNARGSGSRGAGGIGRGSYVPSHVKAMYRKNPPQVCYHALDGLNDWDVRT